MHCNPLVKGGGPAKSKILWGLFEVTRIYSPNVSSRNQYGRELLQECICKSRIACGFSYMVEIGGFEPPTSAMRTQRSPY